MSDTSGTPLTNPTVGTASTEGTLPTVTVSTTEGTITPKVLVNATPIPESLKTAINEPEKIDANKQQKTAEEKPRVIGRPFPKGVSGNPEGRPKRKTITEYIIDELNKTLPSGVTGHQNMARLILQMAFGKRDKNGKILARPDKELIKETWHYLDGLPKQRIESTGLDDGPLQVEIIEHKEKKDDS